MTKQELDDTDCACSLPWLLPVRAKPWVTGWHTTPRRAVDRTPRGPRRRAWSRGRRTCHGGVARAWATPLRVCHRWPSLLPSPGLEGMLTPEGRRAAPLQPVAWCAPERAAAP